MFDSKPTPPRHNARLRNLLPCAALAIAAACPLTAGAIVSDRYLTGVHTFDCEGDWDDTKAGSQSFRLVMKARESVIRLETNGAQEPASPYQLADEAIRFVVRLSESDGAQCQLYLSAGSLSCRRTDTTRTGQFLGVCLPAP